MPKRLFPVLLLLAVGSTALAEPLTLRLQGSNTIGATLAPALVEAWLENQGVTSLQGVELAPEELRITGRTAGGHAVQVDIHSHGSGTAFSGLAAGAADIGMASRPIKPEEVSALAALGQLDRHDSEYVLGLDGIAVIVHPGNPLQRLDKATIARLFSGEVRDWAEVGGRPGPVHVYARDHKSGTWDTFKSLVLGKVPLVTGAMRYESSEALSDAVANDPYGIGFIGLPYVLRAKALAVSEQGTRAIVPRSFSIATEDYALARRLFLYVPEKASGPARAFADFAVSPAGQALVTREGFIAQDILEGEQEHAAQAPAEYVDFTRGARRLSLNFRFREGSAIPDTKAVRDIERLAAYMRRPENTGRRLLLMGFADSNEGIPLHSLELSVHRVDTVADLLITRGVGPVRVRGYGSALPVAGNDTPHGRHKNRRVEVWVR
jgi:phosphate transport system substrate-binding protein